MLETKINNIQDIDILSNLNLSRVEQNNYDEIINIPIEQVIIEDINVAPEPFISEEKKLIDKNIKRFSIFSFISGIVKYIGVSSFIFIILLVTTNYSAYINIAKSYFFQDDMQQQEEAMQSSLESVKLDTRTLSEKLRDKKESRIKATEKNKNSEKSIYSVNNLASEINKTRPKLDIEITPYENRIIIPKIGRNIPLIDIKNKKVLGGPKELENIFMDELENGVIRYPGSKKPGEKGNTFVFGHSSNFPWIKGNYNDVFALLNNVESGDNVIMYYDQKKYTYKIKEKKIVTPGDVKVLKRNNNKDELTLMTCWPIGTTLNRLIVIGDMIEESTDKNY